MARKNLASIDAVIKLNKRVVIHISPHTEAAGRPVHAITLYWPKGQYSAAVYFDRKPMAVSQPNLIVSADEL